MLRPIVTEDSPLTDTSDMLGVHAVFREALERAPARLAPSADENRIDTVGTYYEAVLRLLHAHHEGEDELLTPLLQQRCSADELTAVNRIAAQHQPVSECLQRAGERLAEWRTARDAPSAAALRRALADVQAALIPHLDEEERVVLPIAARRVTPEEWGALPGHALRQFDGADLWLVLGLVFDHLPDEQVAAAQAHMPPPLLAAWNEHGRASYEALRARIED